MTACYFDSEPQEFVCPHCLTREPITVPMPLDEFASEAKAFEREHQRCKEPIGPGERAFLEAAQAYRRAGHAVNRAVRISGMDRVGMIEGSRDCMRMAARARRMKR